MSNDSEPQKAVPAKPNCEPDVIAARLGVAANDGGVVLADRDDITVV